MTVPFVFVCRVISYWTKLCCAVGYPTERKFGVSCDILLDQNLVCCGISYWTKV